MGARQACRILLGGLVGLSLLPATAGAGETAVGDLELSYLRTTVTESNAGIQYGPVDADCNNPDAGLVLSGGNSVSGAGPGEVYLNTAYPLDDQGASDPNTLPDGWRVYTDNVGPGPSYGIGAAAICAAAGPDPVYPAPDSEPNPQNVRSSAAVLCPDGTHAVGGGPFASGFFGEQRVAASGPIDSQDANRIPDDGWRVDMDAIGPSDQTVTAWVICHPDDDFSYVTKRFEARRDERTKGKALCPGGTFNVGGGVLGKGPYNSTWIVDNSTSTKFTVDGLRSKGWKARMEINAGPPRDFKVTAICHS